MKFKINDIVIRKNLRHDRGCVVVEIFDYVNRSSMFKGTLEEAKEFLLEMADDNEWSDAEVQAVKDLPLEEGVIYKWVRENLMCELEEL